MSANDCLDAIQKAMGRSMTDQETLELLELLLERQREEISRGMSHNEAASKAAEDLGEEMRQAALLAKRNALLNAARRREAYEYLKTNWSDRPDLGAESFLVGTNVARLGSRDSVAAAQKQLRDYYRAGLIDDLTRSGHNKVFASGSMDDEVARALWQLNQPEPDLAGVSKIAREIAESIRKWQDIAREDANRAGGFIGKLDNYITRQTHDMFKLRRWGKDAWKAEIRPLIENQLDDEALNEIYDGLSSGVHLKYGDEVPDYRGPASLAKKVSAERVLHFKSADAWMAYNRKYGTGNLREAVFGSLHSLGESTGLMRKLGPNPENNWRMVTEQLEKDLRLSDRGRERFRNQLKRKLKNRFLEVDGSTNIPSSAMGARVGASWRAIQNMAKLGGATISAVADVPLYATEMSYQGESFFKHLLVGLTAPLKGKPKREQREILASLGVFFDSMRGEIVARFAADDSLPGILARAQRQFFKMNLLSPWTESFKASAALMMSHNLAQKSGKSFDQLGDLARALEMYGIDAKAWDEIRSSPQRLADNRRYIVAEDLSPGTADKLRAFITDRVSHAVIEPDARTRSMMFQGTSPGDSLGETLRLVMQFKSFPTAILQKVVGRELFGRGYTPADIGARAMPLKELAQALRSGNGEMLGFVQLMVWSTAFGYLAMSAKDLAKGRTPRDPADGKTLLASALQGGALGIYGDFLFGEANRFGGGALASAMGPTFGAGEGAADIVQRIRDGDDVAASSFRLMISNTPFMNLFYSRIVLDHLFFYQFQEWLNPGYLRRMERRVERENNQTFWLSPK